MIGRDIIDGLYADISYLKEQNKNWEGVYNEQKQRIAELEEELTSVRITTGNYASTMRECAAELERIWESYDCEGPAEIVSKAEETKELILKLRGQSQ